MLMLQNKIKAVREQIKMGKCKYCNGNCPNDPDYMCDGYAGDIDNLYENERANEDD